MLAMEQRDNILTNIIMKSKNHIKPERGMYSPPQVEIVNLKGEGLLCASASINDLGNDFDFDPWGLKEE